MIATWILVQVNIWTASISLKKCVSIPFSSLLREAMCRFQLNVQESTNHYVYTFSQLLMGEIREREEHNDKYSSFHCFFLL